MQKLDPKAKSEAALSRLSHWWSAAPSQTTKLSASKGRIEEGLHADLVVRIFIFDCSIIVEHCPALSQMTRLSGSKGCIEQGLHANLALLPVLNSHTSVLFIDTLMHLQVASVILARLHCAFHVFYCISVPYTLEHLCVMY